MIENDEKISEYIDFPRTFEKYKWYKPILVLIVGLIIFLIFQVLLVLFFNAIYGWNFIIFLQEHPDLLGRVRRAIAF